MDQVTELNKEIAAIGAPASHPYRSQIEITFPEPRSAKMVVDIISVDKELSSDRVIRTISLAADKDEGSYVMMV